jgi:trigger factor
MEKITDIGQIVSLCQTMTNLKLDITCGADRLFAQRWYEERYLTGVHTRYVMKPGLFINSIEDGRVYRAFNTSDEKAVEFMEANENYKDYFIDLQAEPEAPVEGEPEAPVEGEPEADPEAVQVMAADEPEMTEEEIAAAKRSEAAKKAAATRAAKKAEAEAEAEAAEGLKEFEE